MSNLSFSTCIRLSFRAQSNIFARALVSVEDESAWLFGYLKDARRHFFFVGILGSGQLVGLDGRLLQGTPWRLPTTGRLRRGASLRYPLGSQAIQGGQMLRVHGRSEQRQRRDERGGARPHAHARAL